MTSITPSAKLTAQTIMGLVLVALSAGATAYADGITVEPGPAAGIVGALVAILGATNFARRETNPPPSAYEKLRQDGHLNPAAEVALIQAGKLKPKG